MTHRLRGTSLLVLIGTLFIGERALAEGWIDFIRNYDLNDYALEEHGGPREQSRF